jgi:ABC-type oligopeptide transport system substrate-binding subunit
VTAHDFEYAWKRVLDPATESRNAELLYDIKGARPYHEGASSVADGVGVRALDDVTLVVELERPTGYFLHLMSYSATYPIPRHVVEQHGPAWAEPAHIVTNGPFTPGSWQCGDSKVLERYPRYHGRFKGNLQRVVLPDVEDWPAAVEMYEAGLLDIIGLFDRYPDEADRVRQRHAQEYVAQPSLKTLHLAFGVTRPPFDDPRVRQALAFAVDREALAKATTGGYRLPATGGFVPPGMPGHLPGIALPYDPERGRRLLAESGYPGGEGFPHVEMLGPAGLQAQGPYLQALWRENLGIEIQWRLLDWEDFTDRLRAAAAQLIVPGWMPDYPDPDSYLRVAIQRQTVWRHEPYVALVEQARRVLDQEKRLKLYAHAEQILVEQVPILPLLYGCEHLLVKPCVARYPTSPMGTVFWKDVVLEPH